MKEKERERSRDETARKYGGHNFITSKVPGALDREAW
jgi:hypothetical protein